jgi:hypothetical protein
MLSSFWFQLDETFDRMDETRRMLAKADVKEDVQRDREE